MPADIGFDVTDKQLRQLWGTLPKETAQRLMSCSKKHLFEQIRRRYCSRCYGLFALRCVLSSRALVAGRPIIAPACKGDRCTREECRYDELRGAVCGSADGTACEACPSCQQFYLGLTADAKMLRLEASAAPLEVFAIAKQRERDRNLQFIAQGNGHLVGNIVGLNGFGRAWAKSTCRFVCAH